jgi:hypothetical protein
VFSPQSIYAFCVDLRTNSINLLVFFKTGAVFTARYGLGFSNQTRCSFVLGTKEIRSKLCLSLTQYSYTVRLILRNVIVFYLIALTGPFPGAVTTISNSEYKLCHGCPAVCTSERNNLALSG